MWMTHRLVVPPAVLVPGRHTRRTPRSGLCLHACQTPVFHLETEGWLTYPSISLFSKFHALRLRFPCLFSLLLLVYSHMRSDGKNWDILSLLSVEQARRSQKPADWWKGVKRFSQSQGWNVYQEVIYSVLNHICISPGTVPFQAPLPTGTTPPWAVFLSASLAVLVLNISSCR